MESTDVQIGTYHTRTDFGLTLYDLELGMPEVKTSYNSWIGITSSISGNNKTFTVSGGNDGCKLTKIVGAVQFQ